MRHQLSGRQLSRNAPHRAAMLRNMAASLLRHETIRTTMPKAKELRRVVEPLITLSKNDSDANRRLAFSRLRDAEVVVKLFEELGPRFKERPGGYTRILHMNPRPGDAAPMALMQLLDQPEAAEATEEAAPAAKPARVSIRKRAVLTDEQKAAKAARAKEKAEKHAAAKARNAEVRAKSAATARPAAKKKAVKGKAKAGAKKAARK